jgi:hypothetical protein
MAGREDVEDFIRIRELLKGNWWGIVPRIGILLGKVDC